MKELIEYIAKSIVDKPDEVVVVEVPSEDGVILKLQVAPEDTGKVIGKEGRIAKAMRTLLRVAAIRKGTRATLEIVSDAPSPDSSTSESFVNSWPLREFIDKQITPELMADIGAAHRSGRRLFIVTSDLDSQRSVVWNMGAIAAHGGDGDLGLGDARLFQDVDVGGAAAERQRPGPRRQVLADGGVDVDDDHVVAGRHQPVGQPPPHQAGPGDDDVHGAPYLQVRRLSSSSRGRISSLPASMPPI